jgi:hypothetical protein
MSACPPPAVKEAIDEQLDSNALRLCSLHLTSLTSGQLRLVGRCRLTFCAFMLLRARKKPTPILLLCCRDALCTLRGSELRTTSFDQVVEQVQACALKAAELERMQGQSAVCWCYGWFTLMWAWF